jgi:predicted transcriptional regulator
MPASVAFEKHYCVSEVAELWGLSERTIRRIFTDEPGVIKWENGETLVQFGEALDHGIRAERLGDGISGDISEY